MMFHKVAMGRRYNLDRAALTARERALNDVAPPVHVLLKAMAQIREEEERMAAFSPPLAPEAPLPPIPEYRFEEKDPPGCFARGATKG